MLSVHYEMCIISYLSCIYYMSPQYHKNRKHGWSELIHSSAWFFFFLCWQFVFFGERQVTHRRFHANVRLLQCLLWEKLSLCRAASIVQPEFIWNQFALDAPEVDPSASAAACSLRFSYTESGSESSPSYSTKHCPLLLLWWSWHYISTSFTPLN